ncbi:ATP-binding response regulator, partial [Actinoplanes octamycinicus]
MTAADALFASGGETGRLMAGLDWSATELGPVHTWSQTLRAVVRTVLSSRYPMLLLWGPNLIQLYNDAYSTLIGDKHPAALGLDVRVTLAEGWDVLAPLIEEATATGVASWVPALQLLLERAGYPEEAYFSVSHAPVRDDDGVTVGVLTVCSEVTDQVVGERRLRLLRDLALPAAGGPLEVDRTCAQLCQVIGGHALDVPFAAIYLREGDALTRRATVGGVDAQLPERIELDPAGADPWRLRAAAGAVVTELDDVTERLTLTGGPWHDPVRTAVAQPLPSADRAQPIGVLLTGLSPSRALDETYRSFLQLLAQQVAVAIRNARAYQEERDRAATLAELDRAKTDFFTNISHEFRTPLTLMLGPLADALADRDEPLGEAQRGRVDTAWRNAGRLLTLVNELLTFASIEAGTARPAPRVLDLAAFTAELAGVFRAAIERTGLHLVVDCPPLPHPVAIDPELWERIVTNLISNALKFTFVGTIRVGLDADATAVRLTVADTGIGIDAAELPRLFDRFHRVRDARSRSHEGTGIGLALVRELTRLLGGDVEVRSEPGAGTTFTVLVPWAALQPAEAVDAAPAGVVDGDAAPDRLDAARAAADEAVAWSGGDSNEQTGHRVLVADDNSDMRSYLSRLLAAEGWRVETAADGEAALQSIRRSRPALLITDVMMPRMDGFALVRALRGDEATAGLPILMLSARAGQESGVEGLAAGADDYVIKPFRAVELIARVRNLLDLSSARIAGAGHPAADITTVIAAGRALEEPFRIAAGYARA